MPDPTVQNPATPLDTRINESYREDAKQFAPRDNSLLQAPPKHIYDIFSVGDPIIQQGREATGSVFEKGKGTALDNFLTGKSMDPFKTDIADMTTSVGSIDSFLKNEDGVAKRGFSTISNQGDNEDRYAEGFKSDNPDLFSGFHPFKQAAYWGGGFIEKTLESAVIKTGQGFAGLYGLTAGNVFKMIANGGDLTAEKEEHTLANWLAVSTDNMFSKMFDGWDQSLKSRYDYFQEKSDRDKKGFVESLSDGDFWMNDISDGLGFLTSAMFESGLISKLALGTKVASRLAPLAEGVSTDALAGLSKMNRFKSFVTGTANRIGFEGSGHMLVKNAVDLTSQTMALTVIESASEAKEVRDKIYNSYDDKVNPKTGELYTRDERMKLAAQGAADVFKQNMAILIGPKFIETMVFNRIGKAFSKMTGGAVGEAGTASKNLKLQGKSFLEGVKLNKLPILSRVGAYGQTAGLGLMMEGLWEENVQLAISRSAEEAYGGKEYTDDAIGATNKDIAEAGKDNTLIGGGKVWERYKNQTSQFIKGIRDSRYIDDELSKSVGIGGLFGVGGGAVHTAIGQRTQLKADRYWENVINKNKDLFLASSDFFVTEPDFKNPGQTKVVIDPVTKSRVLDKNKVEAALNSMGNMEGIMTVMNNTQINPEDTEDTKNNKSNLKMLNRVARDAMFAKLATFYVKAGKKDLLLGNLASIQNFEDKDIQALGYEPGNMSAEEKKGLFESMKNITNKIEVGNDWIENNVLDNGFDQGEKKGKFGLRYTKKQKQERQEFFEKKKAYLLMLVGQRAISDNLKEELELRKANIATPEFGEDMLAALAATAEQFDKDFSDVNHRLPAIDNHLKVLDEQLKDYWTGLETALSWNPDNKLPTMQSNGEYKNKAREHEINHNKIKLQETIDKQKELEEERKSLVAKRSAIVASEEALELIVNEDGSMSIVPRYKAQTGPEKSIQAINDEKTKRIINIQLEELKIQDKWSNDEWKNVAALKEPKINQVNERKSITNASRYMSDSTNAYNKYFEREVIGRDNTEGTKLKLVRDAVTTKQYKENERKLLQPKRIRSKIDKVISRSNFEKLLELLKTDPDIKTFADIEEIVKNLTKNNFTITQAEKEELKQALAESKPAVELENTLEQMANKIEQWKQEAEDEEDEVKDEAANNLQDELDKLQDNSPINKIFEAIDAFKEKAEDEDINEDLIKRNLADEYLKDSQDITNDFTYQEVDSSVNNEADLAKIEELRQQEEKEKLTTDPSDKTKLDEIYDRYDKLITPLLEKIDANNLEATPKKDNEDDVNGLLNKIKILGEEEKELTRLKEIFEERNEKDEILATPEFKGFIDGLNQQLKQIAATIKYFDKIKDSRLREDKNSLVNASNMNLAEIGLDSKGTVINQPLFDIISKYAPKELIQALMDHLASLEGKDTTEADYWKTKAYISAGIELIKINPDALVELSAYIKKETETKSNAVIAVIGDIMSDTDLEVFEKVYKVSPITSLINLFLGTATYSAVSKSSNHTDNISAIFRYKNHLDLIRFLNDLDSTTDTTDYNRSRNDVDFTKENLVTAMKSHFDVVVLNNLSNRLLTTRNDLQEVEEELVLSNDKNIIIPSNQQVIAFRSFINFFFKNDDIKLPFSNWAYLKAPAGTGKSKIIGEWVSKILDLSEGEVVAAGHTIESSKNINEALKISNPATSVADVIAYLKLKNDDDTIKNDNVKLIVLDEISGFTGPQIKEFNVALADYIKETGNDVKILALGDPNQMVLLEESVTNKIRLSFLPFIETDRQASYITTLPALTIRYRSNNPSINSFSDKFNNNQNNLLNERFQVKYFKDKGVFSVGSSQNFESNIISMLKDMPKIDDKKSRVIITDTEKVAYYEKIVKDNGMEGRVEVTDFINVQGRTINEVYIDIDENNDLFKYNGKLDYQLFNKALYVSTSRATDFVMISGFNNVENVEDPEIDKSLETSKDELEKSKKNFTENRKEEDKILQEWLKDVKEKLSKTETTSTKEKEEEKPEEEKPEEEVTETPGVIEDDSTEEVLDENEEEIPTIDDETDEDIEQEKLAKEKLKKEQEEEEAKRQEELKELELKKTIIKGLGGKIRPVFNVISNVFQSLLNYTTNNRFLSTKQLGYNPEEDIQIAPTKNGDKIMYVKHRHNGLNSVIILAGAKDKDGNVIPNTFKEIGLIPGYKNMDFNAQKELKEMSKYPELKDVVEKITKFLSDDIRPIAALVTLPETGARGKLYKSMALGEMGKDVLATGTFEFGSPLAYVYNVNEADKNQYGTVNADSIVSSIVDSMFPDLSPEDKTKKVNNYKRNSYVKVFSNKSKLEFINLPGNENSNYEFIEVGVPYMIVKGGFKDDMTHIIRLSRAKLSSTNAEHQKFLTPLYTLVENIKTLNSIINDKFYTYGKPYVNKELKAISDAKVGDKIKFVQGPSTNKIITVTQELIDVVKSMRDLTETNSEKQQVDQTKALSPKSTVYIDVNKLTEEEAKLFPDKFITFDKMDSTNPITRDVAISPFTVKEDDSSGMVTLTRKQYVKQADDTYDPTPVILEFKISKEALLESTKNTFKKGKAQSALNLISRGNKSFRDATGLTNKAATVGKASGGKNKLSKGDFLSINSIPKILDVLEIILNFEGNGLDLRVSLPIRTKNLNLSDASDSNIINDQERMDAYLESNFVKVMATEVKISIDPEVKPAPKPKAPKAPVTPDPSTPDTDPISEEDYNNFVDKNIVSDDILSSIATKVKDQQMLSTREMAIFTGKTAEINKIIADSAALPTEPELEKTCQTGFGSTSGVMGGIKF